MTNANASTNRSLLLALALIILFLAALVGTFDWRNLVRFETPYQAVFLTNGQVYFGRLENFDTRHPVLREVYYIQSQVQSDSKQLTNTLIKRGKEWHAPTQMVLNPEHILFIEPVTPGSTVSRLIDELKAKP